MLKFRPHHFLCTLGFRGKGYSPEFVRGFQEIVDALRGEGGDDVQIEVTEVTDSICAPCPNRNGELCASEGRIRTLDSRHAAVLGLKAGDRLTWGEAKALLASRMDPAAFDRACEGCSWKALGVCEESLLELRESISRPAGLTGRSRGRAGKGSAVIASFVLLLQSAAALIPCEAEAARTEAQRVPSSSAEKPRPPSRAKQAARKAVASPKRSAARRAEARAPKRDVRRAQRRDEARRRARQEVVTTTVVEAPVSLEDPQVVNVLYQSLFKRKRTAPGKRIHGALEALGKERFAQARKMTKLLQRDRLYADIGHYLEAEAWLGEARFHHARKNAAKAEAAAEKAIQSYYQVKIVSPGSPFEEVVPAKVADAELLLGDVSVGRSRWKEAQHYYENAFRRVPGRRGLSHLPVNTVNNYAMACAKTENVICSSWMRKLIRAYPRKSPEIASISRHFSNAQGLTLPDRVFESRTRAYKAPDRDQEAFDEAMDVYLKGDVEDAIEKFESFLDQYSKSVHAIRARYWLARALEREGEKERARTIYMGILRESPLSYYGMLASISSGQQVEAFIDATLPKAAARDRYLSPEELKRITRAEVLISEGASELASIELDGIKPRGRLSNPFLMYLATLQYETGKYVSGFRTVQVLIDRDIPDIYSTYGLRLIFPRAHEDLIQKYAKEYQLDAILVLSLIKQESAFDARAMSWAGASGLMQLMPVTALDVAGDTEQRQLLDPDLNIRLGARYLSRLLRRFDGNIALALAGYNAGPGRAARWSRNADPSWGLLEFIESIPYKETRGYVSSIIRNYFWYAHKFFGHRLQSLDYFWGVPGPTQNPTEIPLNSAHLPREGLEKPVGWRAAGLE